VHCITQPRKAKAVVVVEKRKIVEKRDEVPALCIRSAAAPRTRNCFFHVPSRIFLLFITRTARNQMLDAVRSWLRDYVCFHRRNFSAFSSSSCVVITEI